LINTSKDSGNKKITFNLLDKFKLLNNTSSVLSIGAGSGEVELELLKQFDLKLGYIDPSESLAEKFQADMRSTAKTELMQDFHVGTFETFETKNKYDLIMAIHSWYYISTDIKTFKKLFNALSTRGKAFILLTTKADFTKELISEFCPERKNFTSEDFDVALESLGIVHKVYKFQVPVNYKSCFARGGFSVFGQNWISYFLRRDYESLTQNMKNELLEFFNHHKTNNTPFSYCAFLLEKP
ncbi:MAG: class I SAM-dependent methyltransferase, partial [Bdellovibrionales bacterium]|nr:class I SAM-dependent methyltransferase [Bdellovibrionales bacterium]